MKNTNFSPISARELMYPKELFRKDTSSGASDRANTEAEEQNENDKDFFA